MPGDECFAQWRRAELTADFGVSRVDFTTETLRLTPAELMERFFEAVRVLLRLGRVSWAETSADDLGEAAVWYGSSMVAAPTQCSVA